MRRGFTIVELLIVIVVIAILAAITTVAYNGITKRAVESVLRDTLVQVAKAMEVEKIDNGDFTSLPPTIRLASGVGIALTEVSDTSGDFCINATHVGHDDLKFYLERSGEPMAGLCQGEVLATLGEYNNGVAANDPEYISITKPSSASVIAPGDLEFTATTDTNWTKLTLSWKPISGALAYRLNHRQTPVATWVARPMTGGGSSTTWNNASTSYTGNIPPATTSLVWTDQANRPKDLSETHEYRMQYQRSDGSWSDFQQLSLSPMEGRVVPRIKNFEVTPNATWSSLKLSWDSLGTFANLPGVKIRINHKAPGGSWMVKSPTNCGSGTVGDSTAYSGGINPADIESNWTGVQCIPQNVDAVHEFRVQVYSGAVAGDWATLSLDQLSYIGSSQLPKIGNFEVVPAADWSSVTISWTALEDKYINLPGLRMRVNHRDSPTGTWYVKNLGSSGYTQNPWDSTTYSGSTPLNSSSIFWTQPNYRPASGQTHEYRIQLYSGTQTGEWSTVQLSR